MTFTVKMRLATLLFSRLLLFAFFQGLIALLFFSWKESEKYWQLSATLTNFVSISLLIILLRKEKTNFLSMFQFNSSQWKKDLLIFFGLSFLTIPVVMLPGYYLNQYFYGDSNHYSEIMFQTISEPLIYFLLIAFPLSIAFAELPSYFGYIMPQLKSRFKSKILIVSIPAFFLAIQHCTLPLVFEPGFILLRGLVYLPFAFFIAISLYKRPSLLIYFSIFHGLLDAMTVIMLLTEIKNS